MKPRLIKLCALLSITRVAAIAALLLATFGAGCAAAGPAPSAITGTLPFKMELIEVPQSNLPRLHSFSSAATAGKWLIIGGRTAGLHGFDSGTNNFPRSSANTVAYVIDPANNRILGSINLVQALPPELAGPLTATNPQFVQVGTNLFIVGGYGKNLQTGELTTFGSIIKVDVPGLTQAIINNTPIASYFAQNLTADNRLKVTGGGLKQWLGVFYLIFGQDFSGPYSVQDRDYNRAGGQFQRYTEKVRLFTLNADLSINTFTQVDGGYDPNLPYHRRDLNAVDIVQGDGATPGATVYGGVFKAGQVAGHTTPIDVTFAPSIANVTVAVRSNFNQALSHYDCAHVTVFDNLSSNCFTTLFGGISQFHYDKASNTLIRDQVDLAKGVDGLPFINTISTIQRRPDGVFAQYIQPMSLPALLGTEAQFLYDGGLQRGTQILENGVINLAGLRGRTRVGHIYGGIGSFGPYSALVTNTPATVANNRLFQVYLTPGATAVTPMPPLPSTVTAYP